MGKTFRAKRGDYDESMEFRKEKFRSRRVKKLEKKNSHDEGLKPTRDDSEKEEDRASIHFCQ